MRIIQFFALFVFLVGCTSRAAMLQTSTPKGKEYKLYFGRMLIDYDKVEKMNAEERLRNYEEQLNVVLHQDKNTITCSIIPNTINFGEPGSQGVARVSCKEVVLFEVQKGIYTRSGSPLYKYTLSYE